MNRSQHAASEGFSFIELLVALVFVALLMAGMAKVFASSMKVFRTTGEVLSTQRNNTWALNMLSDDISQAGYIFPDRILPDNLIYGTELMFRIDPGQTVSGVTRPSDADPSAVQAETLTADAFQFFADIPLPVTATWKTTTTGETEGGAATELASASVNYSPGSNSADLAAGDIMVILDGGTQTLPDGTEISKMETPMISTVADPIVFQNDAATMLKYTPVSFQYLPIQPHQAGIPLLFVRPAQLVRLSVKAVALDPSRPLVKQPCLVRQQTTYPSNGTSTIDWTTVPSAVVAENVEGFRVDASFNGGTSWARTGAADWATVLSQATSQIQGVTGFTSLTTRRDWFRNVPCLLRIDLTTRTPIRREEYNATAGARAYRTRTQTLMISPRNFGIGL